MSTPSRRSTQWAVVPDANFSRKIAWSSARCAVCRSWFSYLWSPDRSSRSSARQISRSGFCLNAPTITIAPSVVSKTPDKGYAAQLSSRPRMRCIAASCICIASMEL